jgi:putative endonuclease
LFWSKTVTFWVYILQSQTSGRFYCGQTQDIVKRICQHNDPTNDLAKTTKRLKGPWTLIWSTQVESGSEAVRLERQIKKRGIARFLHDPGAGIRQYGDPGAFHVNEGFAVISGDMERRGNA